MSEVPAPITPESGEVKRDQINRALETTKKVVETKPADTLSPQDQQKRDAFLSALDRTKDSETRTYENKFVNADDTSIEYSQEEGIPTNWALEQLNEAIRTTPGGTPEHDELVEARNTIRKHSQAFVDIPGRMDPEKYLNRVRQEAAYVASDARSMGDDTANYFRAHDELQERQELVMPTISAATTTTAHSPSPDTTNPATKPDRVEISIAQDEDMYMKNAIRAAETFLEGQKQGSILDIRTWGRRLKIRSLYELYRQREIGKALKLLHEANNPYATIDLSTNTGSVINKDTDRDVYEQEQKDILDRSRLKSDQNMSLYGEKIKKLDEDGQTLNRKIIDEVIAPYATAGSTMTEQELKDKFNQFVRDNINTPTDTGRILREFLGPTVDGQRAETLSVASDLVEMGKLLRSHNFAIDELQNVVKIRLANLRVSTETQATTHLADRAVSWLQAHRVPISAEAVGLLFSAGTFGLQMLRSRGAQSLGAQMMVPGVGILAAAPVAFARSWVETGRQRTTYMEQRETGREVSPIRTDFSDIRNPLKRKIYEMAARRQVKFMENLEKSSYDMAKVTELVEGGGERRVFDQDRRGLNELLSLDLSIVDNQNALLRRMAEVKVRREYATQHKVATIQYAEGAINRDRLLLDMKMAEGYVKLRHALGTNADAEITRREATEMDHFRTQLGQDRKQQDRSFNFMRLRRAGGSVASIFGTGAITTALGMGAQEVGAVGLRAVGVNVHETAAEKISRAVGDSAVGQAMGIDQMQAGIANAAKAVGAERLIPFRPHELAPDVNQANMLAGGGGIDALRSASSPDTFTLPNGYHATIDSNNRNLLFTDTNGSPVPNTPRFVEQADGSFVAQGQIPDTMRQMLPEWQIKEQTQANPLVQRLVDIQQTGRHEVIQVGGRTIDVQGNSITIPGTNLHGTIDTAGNLNFSGNKQELDALQQVLATQGFGGGVVEHASTTNVASIHNQVREYITNPGGQLGGGNEGLKTFTTVDGMQIRITAGSSHGAELFDPKTGVTWKGEYDFNGNILLRPDQNPGMDLQAVQARLKTAGFTFAEGQGPTGTQTVNALEYLTDNKKVELANRASWHDNQTPMHLNERGILVGADGKELQFYHHVLPDGRVQLDASQMVSHITPQGTWQNWDLTTDNQYNRIMEDIVTKPDGSREYKNFQFLITVNDAADNARQVIAIDMNPDGTMTIPDEYKQFFKIDENGNPVQLARFIEVAHKNADGTRNILSTSVGQGIDTMQVTTKGSSFLTIAPPDVTTPGDPSYSLTTTPPAGGKITSLIPPAAPPPPASPEPLGTPARPDLNLPILTLPFDTASPLAEMRPPVGPYPERLFRPGTKLKDVLRRGKAPAVSNPDVAYNEIEGKQAIREASDAFNRADHIYIALGGAIGDAVIATAYVQAIQEALRQQGKNTPITIVTNHDGLFSTLASSQITIEAAPLDRALQRAEQLALAGSGNNPLLLSYTYTNGQPTIATQSNGGKTITTIDNLLRSGLEQYDNNTDNAKRYARFTEDLFSLNRDSIPADKAATIVELPANKDSIYNAVVTREKIDTTKPQIAVVVEGSGPGKRYSLENWARVIQEIATVHPDHQFNIFYNPGRTDAYTDVEIKQAMTNAGVADKVNLVSGSPTEWAVLSERQKLVLSNDTGLAHIAAAVKTGPPVAILCMPKAFSPEIWTSSPRQVGITLSPDLAATVSANSYFERDEDRKPINKISPSTVAQKALSLM